MVMSFLRGDDDRLEHVQNRLLQMLADDRHSFDIATLALFGGADPQVVGPDLRRSDARVNDGQRTVRRELLVHTVARGRASEVPGVLVYMSVVKDVERIGDYAKNIWDVAAHGANLSDGPDRGEFMAYRDRISEMISEAARIFADEDEDAARAFIEEGDAMLDRFDDHVAVLVRTEAPGRDAVPRALVYRYFKRIVAHLMNLLSAVTMPLDELDYFDEQRRRP